MSLPNKHIKIVLINDLESSELIQFELPHLYFDIVYSHYCHIYVPAEQQIWICVEKAY